MFRIHYMFGVFSTSVPAISIISTLPTIPTLLGIPPNLCCAHINTPHPHTHTCTGGGERGEGRGERKLTFLC